MARAIGRYADPKPPELQRVTLELAVDEAEAVFAVLGAAQHGGPTSSTYEALCKVLPFDWKKQTDLQVRCGIRGV